MEIADRPQERGKVVIKENGGNAHENHKQVFAHIAPHLGGNPEEGAKPIQTDECQNIQKRRDECNEEKRGAEVLAKGLLIPLSEAHGKQSAAPHTQAKDDGSQKGHQRKGRADRRKRIPTKKLPDDQRVGNVIALLQQIP